MAEKDRLTPEEITALFAPEPDPGPGSGAGGGPDEETRGAPGGLPPDLFGRLEAVGGRTLLAAFEDLDDFLEAALSLGPVEVAATRGVDLAGFVEGGVSVRVRLRGELQGGFWLALSSAAVRAVLARVLGASESSLTGELGALHRTALEAPVDEFKDNLVRHLEGDGLPLEVEPGPPRTEPPEVGAEERLICLEAAFELGGEAARVRFYLEEALALGLAKVERERRGGREEAGRSEDLSDRQAGGSQAPVGRLPVPGAKATDAVESPAAPDGPRVEAVLGGTDRLPPAGLAVGVVVRLDALAGALVELRIEGRKVGEGQVVVDDDHYAVRVERLEPAAGSRGAGP